MERETFWVKARTDTFPVQLDQHRQRTLVAMTSGYRFVDMRLLCTEERFEVSLRSFLKIHGLC